MSSLCSLHYFKHFFVNIAYCDGMPTDAHDKMSVAIDANDVAFHPLHRTCGDAQQCVVCGILFQWLEQDADVVGRFLHDAHEGNHLLVRNDGGLMSGAIVDQVIVWQDVLDVCLQMLYVALQENQTTHSGALGRDNFAATFGMMGGAVYEVGDFFVRL